MLPIRRAVLLVFGSAMLASVCPSPLRAQRWTSRHPVTTGAVAFAAATLALLPMDVELTEEFREPAQLRSRFLEHSSTAFNFAGGPGTVIASLGALGVGVIKHDTAWTAVGVRATEAIALSATATALLKGLFGRQRPFINDQRSNIWFIGRGFAGAGRTSFPSGHATSAFALAVATSRELKVRAPRAARIATPLLYGSAVLAAAARVYGAHHWVSDVVAGAGVGTLTGYLVTQHDAEPTARGVRLRF